MTIKKAKIVILILVIVVFMCLVHQSMVLHNKVRILTDLGIPHSSAKLKMDINLTNADASFIGEDAYNEAGQTVSGVGDVNNDGFDDFLIGAPLPESQAGKVYLLFGNKSDHFSKNVNLTHADASFIGEASDNYAGEAIAGAGDVNNDGYDDFLIGAYRNNDGGNWAGKVYLIFGNDSDYFSKNMNLSDADASFIGEASDGEAGRTVAGAGDVNNDGYDDFLIGSRYHNHDQAGKIYLILGKISGWTRDTDLSDADGSFIGEAAGDEAGETLAGACDVNNDGYDDFLIGAVWYNESDGEKLGKVYLILGKTSEWAVNVNLTNADASFIGEAAGDEAGVSIASAGDVNNDTYDDFLIGAPNVATEAGKVYLIFGNESDYFSKNMNLSDADASFIGEALMDEAGYSIAGVGDVNNDTYDDFLIGAPNVATEAGKVYLIFGNESDYFSKNVNLTNADASFIGEALMDEAGYSIAGAGDVNNDGYDDFLIGACKNCDGGIESGKVYLIFPSKTFTSSFFSLLLLLSSPSTEEAIPTFPPLILIPITLGSIIIGALYQFRKKLRTIFAYEWMKQ